MPCRHAVGWNALDTDADLMLTGEMACQHDSAARHCLRAYGRDPLADWSARRHGR